MACVDAVLGGPGATCVSFYICVGWGVVIDWCCCKIVGQSLVKRWQIVGKSMPYICCRCIQVCV